MAKDYRVTPATRLINRVMGGLIRMGMGSKNWYLLTVHGRKTGTPYTMPVSLVQQGEERWLVSPYGETNWVKNARAAGRVTLTRGKISETAHITALSAAESAPILKRYIAQEAITRPYFDAQPDSPVEDFAAEASRHPVFLLTDVS